MKKIILFFLLFFISSNSYANNNIVYLDIQYIIDNSDLGLSYKKIVKSLQDKIKIEINSKQKIIKEKKKYSSRILEILNPLLTKFVDSNNIVLVLEKKNILVGAKSLDITENILIMLNEETKKKKLLDEIN